MASLTWTPSGNAPATVEAVRQSLTALAKKKTGGNLIDKKFKDDHKFLGHAGSVEKLAAALARVRDVKYSTLFFSSLDPTAQAEVLSWIKRVPANNLHFNRGTWTITPIAIEMVNTYKFATVDMEVYKQMSKGDRDNLRKKSNKWLTISQKRPKLSCRFAGTSDGTVVIYHMDY